MDERIRQVFEEILYRTKTTKETIQKKQRHNDRFIIHGMLSLTSSTIMLEGMNTCRIYLQVTFFSDLTKMQALDFPSLSSAKKRYREISNIQWSKQNNPDKNTWSLWKKMITTIYFQTNKSLFLKSTMQLRQWKCNQFQYTQIHPYLYSQSTMEIYQRNPNKTTH